MINVNEMSDEAAREAIEKGKLPSSLTNPSGLAGLIFTQSWCGEWKALSRTLKVLEKEDPWGPDEELYVWYLEYDRKPYFKDFMKFKEGILGNSLVPYIRYYRKGELLGESNYVSRHGFEAMFNSGK